MISLLLNSLYDTVQSKQTQSGAVGTDPSHTQLAKDHADHHFNDLAGYMVYLVVKRIGQEMVKCWKGDKNTSIESIINLVEQRYFVHPCDVDWVDEHIEKWAKNNPNKVKRGEVKQYMNMEKKNLISLKKLLMIKSNNTLKATAAIVLMLGCVVSSCKLMGCEECTIEIDQKLDKIRQGDFATYKIFMQEHADPEYKCCVTNSVINSEVHKLKNSVRSSLDIEIITDFFSYNLSQDTKNSFLNAYWTGSEHEEITRFLIDQGCKIKYSNYCDSSFLVGLKKLHKLGYDMNYIDPKYGTNLFLDFSAIGYEQKVFKDGECAVECLKYLKSIGVNTKLKDVDGKNALELASDPIIIDYLKGI